MRGSPDLSRRREVRREPGRSWPGLRRGLRGRAPSPGFHHRRVVTPHLLGVAAHPAGCPATPRGGHGNATFRESKETTMPPLATLERELGDAIARIPVPRVHLTTPADAD